MAPELELQVVVRPLRPADRAEVERIDRIAGGRDAAASWRQVFRRCVGADAGAVGLCADAGRGRGLDGFLLGEVRALEFGSDACGWVFAVGVDPAARRRGVGSALLRAAVRAFRGQGVQRIRTMVARADVPLQAFFRSAGFVGGPYVQLELEPPPPPGDLT